MSYTWPKKGEKLFKTTDSYYVSSPYSVMFTQFRQ
jgi:hypothetical protein